MNLRNSSILATAVLCILCVCLGLLLRSENNNSSAATGFYALGGESVDLGQLDQGDETVHLFTLQNKLDTRVRIAEIRTSCTCTAASEIQGANEGYIAQGRSVNLPITFSVGGRTGNINASVDVIYHLEGSTDARRLRLNLRANVPPEARIEPEVIDFGTLNDLLSNRVVRQLKFVPLRDGIEVLQATASDKRIDVRKQATSSSKTQTIFEVSVDPMDFAKGEALREAITLKLSSSRAPEHRVKVIGRFEKSVVANPRAIVFQVESPEAKHSASVAVQSLVPSVVTNATLTPSEAGHIVVFKGNRSSEHTVEVVLHGPLKTSVDMMAKVELVMESDDKQSISREVVIPIHIIRNEP